MSSSHLEVLKHVMRVIAITRCRRCVRDCVGDVAGIYGGVGRTNLAALTGHEVYVVSDLSSFRIVSPNTFSMHVS